MRSDTHYAEMMYGKLSAEYSIAEELTNIKNTLLSTNFVRLVKNCKMEEVAYVVNLKEDTNKICLTITKIQKNKQSGKIKEKIIDKKTRTPNHKTYMIEYFIDNFVYDLVLRGYRKEREECK